MMNTKKREFGLIIIFLFLAISIQAAALRGSVTDKITNEPLIGAVIQISGTTTGVITDLDGNFELAGLRNGTYKLVISKVSYKTLTLEVAVNGMSEINITLEPDNQQLKESAGYSYANRNMPDRRRYNTVLNTDTNQLEVENLNEINREFSRLNEHILSANLNYQHDFAFGDFTPTLKLGGYTECRKDNVNPVIGSV